MNLRDLAPYIWIAWDLLAVFIIFQRVNVCARKGLAATLVGLLVYVAAVAAAGYANKPVALYLYDNIVRDAVQNVLAHEFGLVLDGAGGDSLSLLESIPSVLKLLMGAGGKEIPSLSVNAATTSGMAEKLASQVIDSALEEPLMTVLHAVSFLLIFSLAAFLMRSLARMFTGVNSVPVIGGVNTVLGGIFGLFEAALTLYVGAFVLRLLIMFSGSSWWWLNEKVIGATYIWSIFY